MATAKKPLPKNTPSQQKFPTEADLRATGKTANNDNKTSGDAKSHTKAGSKEGAGGGKKQERQH